MFFVDQSILTNEIDFHRIRKLKSVMFKTVIHVILAYMGKPSCYSIRFNTKKSKSLDSECSPTQTILACRKINQKWKASTYVGFFAWNSFFQTKNFISMNLFCMVQKVLKRVILNKILYFKWNHLITDWDWVMQQLSKFNESNFWKLYFEDVRMKW